jgi:hypothetical protein
LTGPEDEVPTNQLEIDKRLDMWGGYWRSRRRTHFCGSIEHEYHIPWRQWHYPELRAQLTRYDLADILQIEKIMRYMPQQHREALVRYYGYRQDPRKICNRLSIRYADFGRWMTHCRAMVINLLTRHFGGVESPSNSTRPPSGEDKCGSQAPAFLMATAT